MVIYRSKPIIGKEEHDAFTRVLDSGIFVKGPEAAALEKEFASYCGIQQAVAVNSGTSALELSIQALGIGPGDEVITAANSFMATSNAIETNGAKAVFVDVNPETFNIEPEKVRKAITGKTKAIMPVHLYGQCADMRQLSEIAESHGIPVIEDACQAHGAKCGSAKAGSIGTLGCFSFFPAKNMTVGGDGGIITTNNAELADKIRMLRNAGRGKDAHDAIIVGHNNRISEILAAIGRVQLKKLDRWNSKRRGLARDYNSNLGDSGVITPKEAKNNYHVYHLYTIKTRKRDGLMEHLKSRGINCDVNYPIPCPLMTAYRKKWGYSPGSWPNTERIAHEILSIPMWPGLSEEQIHYISNEIKNFLKTSQAH